MPSGDDGARDDPLLSDRSWAVTSYGLDVEALAAAPNSHRDRRGRRVRGHLHRTHVAGRRRAARSTGEPLPKSSRRLPRRRVWIRGANRRHSRADSATSSIKAERLYGRRCCLPRGDTGRRSGSGADCAAAAKKIGTVVSHPPDAPVRRRGAEGLRLAIGGEDGWLGLEPPPGSVSSGAESGTRYSTDGPKASAGEQKSISTNATMLVCCGTTWSAAPRPAPTEQRE